MRIAATALGALAGVALALVGAGALGTTRAATAAAAAQEAGALRVPATVERVVDGDTLRVAARPWPGWTVRVAVRLAGVDTPERRGACTAERDAAERARAALAALTPAGSDVWLLTPRMGAFAGRVVAEVHAPGAGDVAERLIVAGHGRPYAGGARAGWCD